MSESAPTPTIAEIVTDTTALRPREKNLILAAAHFLHDPTPDELDFLHATFAQVGLPRSRTSERIYERRCGNASVRVEAGALYDGHNWIDQPLPYGSRPRLLNIHITTYAVRHKTRVIPLGESKRDAMRMLGIRTASGGRNGRMTNFDQQLRAFCAMRLKLGTANAYSAKTIDTKPVRSFDAWFVPEGAQRPLWPGEIELSADYYDSIREFAFPLDPRAIDILDRSALALDLYAYLAHRLCRIPRHKPLVLHWASLREHFGIEGQDKRNFKRDLIAALKQVKCVYPAARVGPIAGGLLMQASEPPIAKVAVMVSGLR